MNEGLPSEDATRLLGAAADGDREAADRLLPLVYEQLRRAAQNQLGQQGPQTLSATALVHEAYLKLVGPREVPWAGRAHFYAAAAQAMRQVLLDRARSRGARERRENGSARAALAIAGLGGLDLSGELDGFVALDGALLRLESVDAQAAAVVRLRFYAGLDVGRTGAALGISERTVKRDWAFARGWLRQELEKADGS